MSVKEQFALLLVCSCYVTNGWPHSLFVVAMSLLLIMHSTHTHILKLRLNGSKHTQFEHEYAFIEVTRDYSDGVIFLLEQT